MFPKKPLNGLTPIGCATMVIIPHSSAVYKDYDNTVIKPESIESTGAESP